MDRIFTAAQVAELLGVDVDKVTAWCKSGELRASNIACGTGRKGRWRIREHAVDEFLERRANTPLRKPARRRKHTAGVIEFY